MNDQNRTTTGTDQRSAIGQPQFGVRSSQLPEALGQSDDFVVISRSGKVWTSYRDMKGAHQLLKDAVDKYEPATT